MADVQWYYARHDEQFGPVSATELKQLAEAGRLSPDDLLWREGMDAWTTAINLRGLFGGESTPAKAGPLDAIAEGPVVPVRARADRGAASVDSVRALLRSTQAALWGICVLVVLAGLALFTRAFLVAETPVQEAAAGAVYGTFFVAAYVLARSGEKLTRLLLARSRRRSK